MSGIHKVERFTFAGGATRFFRSVAARPADAGRLLAMDGLFILAILASVLWVWPMLKGLGLESWQTGLVQPTALCLFLLALLVWDTAWQRFLSGKPTPALIPWRLGADEMLQFRAWIMLAMLMFAIGLMVMAVVFPIVVLGQALPAIRPALLFLLVPVSLVLFVVVQRFYCGISLTMAQGRMSVFDGFSGVKRHLWPFVGALIALTVLTAGAPALFDMTRGTDFSFNFGGMNIGRANMPDAWLPAIAWMTLHAAGYHIMRGLFMESALVTAHLGPVSPSPRKDENAAPAPA